MLQFFCSIPGDDHQTLIISLLQIRTMSRFPSLSYPCQMMHEISQFKGNKQHHELKEKESILGWEPESICKHRDAIESARSCWQNQSIIQICACGSFLQSESCITRLITFWLYFHQMNPLVQHFGYSEFWSDSYKVVCR